MRRRRKEHFRYINLSALFDPLYVDFYQKIIDHKRWMRSWDCKIEPFKSKFAFSIGFPILEERLNYANLCEIKFVPGFRQFERFCRCNLFIIHGSPSVQCLWPQNIITLHKQPRIFRIWNKILPLLNAIIQGNKQSDDKHITSHDLSEMILEVLIFIKVFIITLLFMMLPTLM